LLVAAIPLAIALVNYKLNFDANAVGLHLFADPRTLISDIASQMTFLAITICILALSDYWDFRSDRASHRLGYTLPQLRILQTVTVFLLSALVMFNFLMYYSEILSVTVLDFRLKTANPPDPKLLKNFRHTADKIMIYSGLLLASSVALYLSYFCVQTEQKLLGRLFRSYQS
jgi:hypothetical protein